ncbi:MAG: hypothetical protein JNK85_18605 [Verrucomicrobiales bacterium]|nr:hypothetical protein [Verrucomicrobiales bacterium]
MKTDPLLVLFVLASLSGASLGAATREGPVAAKSTLAPEPALARYRAELNRFRETFGGAQDVPDERFFLFGMGLREKLVYQKGALVKAPSGEIVRRWSVREDFILPADYMVVIRTTDDHEARIIEDEHGVWWVENGVASQIPETGTPVRLPDFAAYPFPAVLRVLHQELLVNVTPRGPVPNFFVYAKPWYRDGAMMAMAFKETGNLDCIRAWIRGLNSAFDRNNAGETEADNLGQVLFLLSLVSDKNHPLVTKVLTEAVPFERTESFGRFLQGRSDFAPHPVYQTKWMKYGLRALDLPDPYTVPPVTDSYSALFWMDYREAHIPGRDADDRDKYPYLGWACDHFHGARKSPISNRDYPLTWEAHASQAHYQGIRPLSETYADRKMAAPHTWHAAEVLLYFLRAIP